MRSSHDAAARPTGAEARVTRTRALHTSASYNGTPMLPTGVFAPLPTPVDDAGWPRLRSVSAPDRAVEALRLAPTSLEDASA